MVLDNSWEDMNRAREFVKRGSTVRRVGAELVISMKVPFFFSVSFLQKPQQGWSSRIGGSEEYS